MTWTPSSIDYWVQYWILLNFTVFSSWGKILTLSLGGRVIFPWSGIRTKSFGVTDYILYQKSLLFRGPCLKTGMLSPDMGSVSHRYKPYSNMVCLGCWSYKACVSNMRNWSLVTGHLGWSKFVYGQLHGNSKVLTDADGFGGRIMS